MESITLIIPDSPFLIQPRTFPMLGPLYLSKVLKSRGVRVKVVDLTGGIKYIPLVDTEYVGITATFQQFPAALDLLKRIKAKYPEVKVIIGGPHVSSTYSTCINYGFDHIIVGEGELAILKLAFGQRKESVISEEPMENIDIIPFPDRDAIDLLSYEYRLDGKRTTNMITSRGCPFRCAFCCKAPWGQRIRLRTAENVLREVDELKSRGYHGIMFYDDEFFISAGRDAEIAQGLKSRGMVWRCFSRSDLILKNKDVIKTAASCGLYEMLIGIESGSDRILDNIHKGVGRRQNLEAVKLLKELGIRVKAAIIVGLPGEDKASIKDTESFLEEAQPDVCDFTLLNVMPGSEIHMNPRNYDVKFKVSPTPYKTKPGEYRSTISTSSMTSKELMAERDRLEKKFSPQLYKGEK